MDKFVRLVAKACPLLLANVDTDQILPARFLKLPRSPELGRALLHDLRRDVDGNERPDFPLNQPQWRDATVLIAGRNFGVGSGRPIGEVFARLGIRAVVAESFNGLGWRNCVNAGLPSLPCPGILKAFDEGDVAEVDAVSGVVRNLTSGVSITGNPLPPAIQEIVAAGGVEATLRASGHLKAPEGSNT